MGFRIVTGRGCLVAPGITKVRRLSLEAHESEIAVPCVSQQKIRVDLRGVIVYKVGDDYRSIANAARRFLDRPAQELETKVQNVFVGHLRAIAGSMTVEDMISDQDKFAQQVRDRCSQEMESFGLVIDSFQIQSITSPSNYIENLAAPHQAEVEQNARIARANAERTAVGQEQIAQAQMAESLRDTNIKKAGFQAEIDTAPQLAAQQGPLSEAKAHQAVVDGADPRRRAAGAAEGAAAPGRRAPPGRRRGVPADHARRGRTRRAHPPGRSRGAGGPSPRGGGRGADQGPGRGAGRCAQDAGDRAGGRDPAHRSGGRRRHQGQGPRRGRRDPGPHGGGGRGHRAPRRRVEPEPGGGHRSADRREAARRSSPPPRPPFEHVGQFTVLNGAQGVTGALAEIIQQAGALTGLARHSLLPAITQATAEAGSGNGSASRNGAEYGNGARNGRRARQTPVTITDPAPAGTDASEEHATK